jgi:hypothetical protein
MIVRKVFLASITFALQIGLAHAEQVVRQVGGTEITFPIQKGYCLAEESNPRDAIFVNNMATLLRNAKNKLILAMLDCARRTAVRNGAGGDILDYSTFYIPMANEAPIMEGDKPSLRKNLCVDMRKQGDATLAPVKDYVANAAKELNTTIAINSTKVIGVVGEDEHGCYLAILVGVRLADNHNLLRSVLITSTVVHGKMIFSGNYHIYKGPETTERSLQEAKALAKAFDAANP